MEEAPEDIINGVKAILSMDEEGKAIAPERQANGVKNAFESLKKRNNNGGGGGKSGRGGGKSSR
jgi:hypothetical protein